MSRYPHIYGQHWGEHGSVPENTPKPTETVNTLSDYTSHEKKTPVNLKEKNEISDGPSSCVNSSVQTRA